MIGDYILFLVIGDYILASYELLWYHCPLLGGRIVIFVSVQIVLLLGVHAWISLLCKMCTVIALKLKVNLKSQKDAKPTLILFYMLACLRCQAGWFVHRISLCSKMPIQKMRYREIRKSYQLLRALVLLYKKVITLKSVQHNGLISLTSESWGQPMGSMAF